MTGPAPALTTPDFWERYIRGQRLPRINDARRMPWRALDRIIARHLPSGRLRVVEVGCAASAWLPAFATRGHDCFGVDYSRIGCALAVANLRAFGFAGAVWCADLFAAATRPGEFDVVFSNGLVEHFTDTGGVVAAVAAFARPGGVVVTLVPNLAGVGGRVFRRLNPRGFATHVVLTPDDLRRAHDGAGLVTEFAGWAGVWFPFLAATLPSERSPALKLALKAAVHGTARPVWAAAALTGRYPEGRWTSPYVLAIARRPA